MVGKLIRKVFGSRNDRMVRAMRRVVEQSNGYESELQALDDDALRGKTDELRGRHAGGETLDAHRISGEFCVERLFGGASVGAAASESSSTDLRQ